MIRILRYSKKNQRFCGKTKLKNICLRLNNVHWGHIPLSKQQSAINQQFAITHGIWSTYLQLNIILFEHNR